MKFTSALMIAFLLLSLPVGADSITLKSGETIEWRIMRDKGDAIEVELSNGAVRTIDKRDVAKITTTYVKPLTGASFTLDGKTRTTDLLAGTDIKKGTVFGVVKMGSAGLILRSEIDAPTILAFPNKMPEEYDLSVLVERRSVIGNFVLGIVIMGERQVAIEFDAERGSKTMVHGLPGATVSGSIFEKGKPIEVKVQVRKSRLIVTASGKEMINQETNWSGACAPDLFKVPNRQALFLSTQRIYGNEEHAHFNVGRLTMTSK